MTEYIDISEYKSVILSRKLTPDVTKSQVTKPNKNNAKRVLILLENKGKITLLIFYAPVHDIRKS